MKKVSSPAGGTVPASGAPQMGWLMDVKNTIMTGNILDRSELQWTDV
jgi:hypothetical protein